MAATQFVCCRWVVLPHLALLRLCAAIQAHVHMAMQVEEGLQHIKHLGHLQ
jgi:hypothetical protein